MKPGYVVRVLGPIDVVTPSGICRVGGRRSQALLGALVLSLGRAVPADHLVEVVWGDTPPSSATDTLQSYISRLRRLLDSGAILREDHSYVLLAGLESVDALQFEALFSDALDARAEPARCRRLCQQALSLWRGVPFGELADEFPFRLEAIRLDELRQSVMELRFEADLALGHRDLVVGALEAAVEENPYRERLWYLLIDALGQQGRRVEALRACYQLRAVLGDAGLDAGPRLTDVEDRLLAG